MYVLSEHRLVTPSVCPLWQGASTCGEGRYAIDSVSVLSHFCRNSMETPTQELWLLNFLAVSATLATRDLVFPHHRTGVDDHFVSTLFSFAVPWMCFPSYLARLEQPALMPTTEEEQQGADYTRDVDFPSVSR
jgi:hypothetical protein